MMRSRGLNRFYKGGESAGARIGGKPIETSDGTQSLAATHLMIALRLPCRVCHPRAPARREATLMLLPAGLEQRMLVLKGERNA